MICTCRGLTWPEGPMERGGVERWPSPCIPIWLNWFIPIQTTQSQPHGYSGTAENILLSVPNPLTCKWLKWLKKSSDYFINLWIRNYFKSNVLPICNGKIWFDNGQVCHHSLACKPLMTGLCAKQACFLLADTAAACCHGYLDYRQHVDYKCFCLVN